VIYPGRGIAVAIVILISAIVIFSNGDDDEERVNQEAPRVVAPVDPTLGARGACRSYVKNALNDPSSADWEPGFTWNVIDHGGGRWTVYPRLRANNTFGAMIATVFECEVQLSGGRWSLINLSEL